MMRIAVLIALLAGCLQNHDPATQSLGRENCDTCHEPEYLSTPQRNVADRTIPDHVAKNYPRTCADCHNTMTWDSHPELLFPITKGAHAAASVTCDGCHDQSKGANVYGENTVCASCHPATESIAGRTLTQTHLDHPDNLFPQNHGAHGGPNWPCTTCHVGTLPTTFDGYTNPPAGFTSNNFCLKCHPTGQGPSSGGGTTARCVIGGCHQDAHHRNDTADQCLACHPRGGGGGG